MTRYGMPEVIVPQMMELLSRNEGFWLVVTGYSMTPTLRHLKDRVYVSPPGGKAKKGDIALLALRSNHCLLHRVARCKDNVLYLKGDALQGMEGPFPIKDVIGIVKKVERDGKVYPVNSVYQLKNAIWTVDWRLRCIARKLLFLFAKE